ncbi:MAG: radical SAM protein [Myxococcales bacterium]|nr:MAG: radical SAM protein [Myxococcales bacterium]
MANLGYIQIARRCNQKCVFCSNPANGLVLTFDQAVAYVDDFVARGYHGIILTGGEPTLFEPLEELIHYARERGMPSRMITNGQKTARADYLARLVEAGLTHLHLSIHSWREDVHDYLTQTPGSLKKQRMSLENVEKLGITADVNCVINKHNADHLHENVRWIVEHFPFVSHFVWNNLDPLLNQEMNLDDVLPKLRDFEVSLMKAMRWLDLQGRTFRVERVPLCAMAEYAHCSTETRKIVKQEERTVHFLDQKQTVRQTEWRHDKGEACKVCRFNPICAGLYQMNVYYDERELSPVFLDPQEVIDRIRADQASNPDEPQRRLAAGQCGPDPGREPA